MSTRLLNQSPPYLWEPTEEQIQASHIQAFAKFCGQSLFPYDRFHRWSISHIGDFWSHV
ncbi:hypothetical protein [Gracilibacillus sp. JCM 18860]|uniref:hypothetical protein n=1 Tax=Gracilibacillus sp. JCM 18860 TaxID=1306159 RepID=UPI000AC739E8